MNFRSFFDLSNIIRNKINLLPNDVDLIVGIPRSGLLVANYISLLLNKPLTDVDGLLEGRILSSGKSKDTTNHINIVSEAKKILVVDDSIYSGKSMEECKQKLKEYKYDATFIYCAIYALPTCITQIDIYFEILNSPRLFEWNIFSHQYLMPKMCFDMDGVLCEEPLRDDNDDGEKYIRFICNAKVKFYPSGTLGCIVTSRLEKYRKQTEDWLERKGIKYNSLVMLSATAEERVRNNLHAIHKAKYYGQSDYVLFVESDEKQAIEINRITKKPVYCVANGVFYTGGLEYILKNETKDRLLEYLRKIPLLKWLYQ